MRYQIPDDRLIGGEKDTENYTENDTENYIENYTEKYIENYKLCIALCVSFRRKK